MSSWPIPKIVYDPGSGAETLNFVYPPVQKPYLDDLEAKRHDSMTSGGLRQSVLERTDTIKILQMETVPWPAHDFPTAHTPAGTLTKAISRSLAGVYGPDIVYDYSPAGAYAASGADSGSVPLRFEIAGIFVVLNTSVAPGAFTPQYGFGIFLAGSWYDIIPSSTQPTGSQSWRVDITSLIVAAGGIASFDFSSVQVRVTQASSTFSDGPGATLTVTGLGLLFTFNDDPTHAYLQLFNDATVYPAWVAPSWPPQPPDGSAYGTATSDLVGDPSTTLSIAAGFLTPKIVYDPGSGPVTLAFTYPDTSKPYADLLEAVRHDSISGSGVRQSFLERIDILKNLQVTSVPWVDLPDWGAFLKYALGGGSFLFYPDADGPVYTIWELSDDKFSPKFVARGLSQLTLKIRRIGAGNFTPTDSNDPTYGDTYNWQRFMLYALQGGNFLYYPDRAATAYQTWQLQDTGWTPAFSSRGFSKFTVKLRLVPGGASSA